jgi:hypothetical protein
VIDRLGWSGSCALREIVLAIGNRKSPRERIGDGDEGLARRFTGHRTHHASMMSMQAMGSNTMIRSQIQVDLNNMMKRLDTPDSPAREIARVDIRIVYQPSGATRIHRHEQINLLVNLSLSVAIAFAFGLCSTNSAHTPQQFLFGIRPSRNFLAV